MLQQPSSTNRNDGHMSDDSSSTPSSEGEEVEGYSLTTTTLKICTEYLTRIKITQEELNQERANNIVASNYIFPVLKPGEEWEGIRDEEIEGLLLDEILNFLCSPEHVDDFVNKYEFIELYFNVMATNTSINVSSHVRIVKCIEEYYHFYALFANEDRYSDSRIIYENTVLVNIIKYLMKFLGEMSKYLKGKNLKYLSLFMHGIAILDKYLLKLTSNQRILKVINDALLNFSMDMFNSLLPSEEDNTTDANCDSVTLICSTLAKIPTVRQHSHNFILKKQLEYQNQQPKLWNTTFQIALLIGLFTCKGYDAFLFSNLQHENELVAYTCIWSLGTVCEDKKPLVAKLQHIFVTDSRAMIKRSILKIFSTYVMQDEHIGMDMYDSIFKILPHSVIDDLRTKSYDTLTSTWFLMSLIIKKSQNRDAYICSVIDLFDDLEKSMSLQCTESGSYAKIDPGFKKVHAVYFKLLSDKKVLKYLRFNLLIRRKLRESVFVSLRRMVFSVRIVDRHFTENLEDYMGMVVGLMDDEMIRYMKEDQLVVSKCLFKSNVINKQMGNSYFSLIAQLGVHLEDILSIKEIFLLLTERMLFQIPKKITQIEKVEDVIILLYILNSTGEVLRTYGSKIAQNTDLKTNFLESLETNIINIFNSKDMIKGVGSIGKSVDVIVMLKSVFCSTISKIYCYCDENLILKNFKKVRDILLFYPEIPHLRMGLEQLEYFAAFIDILEHITDTDERVDFDFLQNIQLLERSVSVLQRFKNATDAFYFRSALGVTNEGESLTQDWKILVIKSIRLRNLLETQIQDLAHA